MSKHTCTTFLAGKKATLDGSTIVCRQEDYSNQFDPQRFKVILPEQQPRLYQSKNSKFKLELSEQPMRYTSTPDADDRAGVFAAGGINAANVSMTGTETITTNSRILSWDPYNEEDGLGEEDFVTLVLPYIHTAREGVERLGKLLEQYGTYESNAIAFGDHDEVWYLETIGGHNWAAIRIPDNAYVIAPNRLNITNFDFSAATTMSSAGLQSLIDEHHLNPALNGQTYNLRQIFGSQTITDQSYNNPRAWYVQKQLSNLDQNPTDQDLPFINYADHLLSVEEIKQLMSSHYQNTPYDPYNNDHAPYRSIALNRNLELHILQIRNDVADQVAGVHWLAFGPNTFNVVVPFFANVNDTPAVYRDTETTFNVNQMYWLNHTITAIGDHLYRLAVPKVEQNAQTVMSKTMALQHQADQSQLAGAELTEYLTQVNEQMADIAFTQAQQLLGELVTLSFKHERLQF